MDSDTRTLKSRGHGHADSSATSSKFAAHGGAEDGCISGSSGATGNDGSIGDGSSTATGGLGLASDTSAQTASTDLTTELEAWASRTHYQVSNVRALQAELKRVRHAGQTGPVPTLPLAHAFVATPSTPSSSSRACGKITTALEDRLKRRLEIEKDIAIALQCQEESMTQTVFRVRDRVNEMSRASSKLWAAVNVSEKRLELRATRPSKERIRDAFQVALERERTELLEVHRKLGEQMGAGAEVIQAAERAQEEMLEHKLTLHLDRSNWPRQFLKKMKELEVAASQFNITADSVYREVTAVSERVHKKTTKTMEKQIKELRHMRQHLEHEVGQSSSTIRSAQADLDKLRKTIGRYYESPENASTKKDADGAESNAFSHGKASISFSVLANIRSKIKAASYTGSAGRQIDVIFSRADKDGSGELDEDEVRRVLRRTLKIPPSSVADPEISALCTTLDSDGSGSVSVREIVDFLNADVDIKRVEEHYARTKSLLEQLHEAHGQMVEDLRNKAAAWNIEIGCSRVTLIKGLELDALPEHVKPSELLIAKRKKPLEPRVVEKVRTKLNSAAYEIPGRNLEVLFGGFDKDGSGQLEDSEFRKALRGVLNIPIYQVSDAEISSLCAMLDGDDSGAISIAEILEFIGPKPIGDRGCLGPIKMVGARGPKKGPPPQSPLSARPQTSPAVGSNSSLWARPQSSSQSARGPKPGNSCNSCGRTDFLQTLPCSLEPVAGQSQTGAPVRFPNALDALPPGRANTAGGGALGQAAGVAAAGPGQLKDSTIQFSTRGASPRGGCNMPALVK